MLLYNLVITLYHLGIRLAALTNGKAEKWVAGRKDLLDRIAAEVEPGGNLIWMHCASLGEFEQGRPVAERLKRQFPEMKLLLTFFSPSGYEVRKDYEHADHVCYLPEDSRRNAQRFLEIVKPDMAVFVKYEYWLHYLSALQRAGVPAFLISARFRTDQVFFRWYGGIFRKAMHTFKTIFVQDEPSYRLALSLGLQNTIISGDTRYDRVTETVEHSGDIEGLENFTKGALVLVGGSTWPVDEAFLLPYINAASQNIKLILAPHVVSGEHIAEVVKHVSVPCVKFSEMDTANLGETRVLIIDNVGMLSHLYRYGHIAYVGGGFTGALHNILEPAAFGMPVLFGPKHEKFPEAGALIEAGGAFSVADGLDFVKRMDFLSAPFIIKIAAEVSKKFIRERTGASDMIVNAIVDSAKQAAV